MAKNCKWATCTNVKRKHSLTQWSNKFNNVLSETIQKKITLNIKSGE